MYDRLDERLINLLGQDARQSSEALAKQLDVSAATIRRRLKKLVKSGIIRTVAVVDPDKSGFPLTAIIAFDVAHDKLQSTAQMLSEKPEIKWVSTTTGRFDIIALARFQSTDQLSDFLQREVSTIEGLRDTETFICLHVNRGRYMPL